MNPSEQHLLEATGFLLEDLLPRPRVDLGEEAQRGRRGTGREFFPDARWRSPSDLSVYFKFEPATPDDRTVSTWRREIWNEGSAPLLWVISPEKIDLYNGFGVPYRDDDVDVDKHRLKTFPNIAGKHDRLDEFAGHRAMETGQFWQNAPNVNRDHSVDRQLLTGLRLLERNLVQTDLVRSEAQGLIGRSIFTQYLIDRKIVGKDWLIDYCGHDHLADILRDEAATEKLFSWLKDTFNGDMFPAQTKAVRPRSIHLEEVADFLAADDLETGQTSLFPYQFDIIPVEVISSIYEQFAHAALSPAKPRPRGKAETDVYYTRLPVVSLVLDEVMDGLDGTESVLDITCGSGVFLVEALRRLVRARAKAEKVPPTRQMIREVLHEQVYGADISEAAVRVAAFSLYLVALELDPDPRSPRGLKFKPLIGQTLLVGDARQVQIRPAGDGSAHSRDELMEFDFIVGNPPWSFPGRKNAVERGAGMPSETPLSPREVSFDFVWCAHKFAHEETRFGLILSATAFFGRSPAAIAAVRHLLESLSSVKLVNLANHAGWLFPKSRMPAVAFFGHHRPTLDKGDPITVVQVPGSPASHRTHTFEIAPSDTVKLPRSAWVNRPDLLKTAACGGRQDMLLLDRLAADHATLDNQLKELGTTLGRGMAFGNRGCDASGLRGLPLLEAKDLGPFSVPDDLRAYDGGRAERPRERDSYRAPLLIVKKSLKGGRPVVAVADRDILFTGTYYGAAFPEEKRDHARLLAGILSSSFASWYLVMTSSSFGLWSRQFLPKDILQLPTPDLSKALESKAGRDILRKQDEMGGRSPEGGEWQALDDSVSELYGLDKADRIVVDDGYFRASWEWKSGIVASVQPADIEDHVLGYAHTFVGTIDAWLSARNCRRLRAEVFNLPPRAPLRAIRFVLEETPGPSIAEIVTPDDDLDELLAQTGERLGVDVAKSLDEQRELRIHGTDEVVIIKPAARRHWMKVAALNDADVVVVESFTNTRTR